jgi:hypothetical protein
MSEEFKSIRPKLLKKLGADLFDFEFVGENIKHPTLGICPASYKETYNKGRFHNEQVFKRMKLIEGKDGECHMNSYRLMAAGKIDKICTGFALMSYNGKTVAFLHWWGLKDGRIIETIPNFYKNATRYFGYTMSMQDIYDYLEELDMTEEGYTAEDVEEIRDLIGGRLDEIDKQKTN